MASRWKCSLEFSVLSSNFHPARLAVGPFQFKLPSSFHKAVAEQWSECVFILLCVPWKLWVSRGVLWYWIRASNGESWVYSSSNYIPRGWKLDLLKAVLQSLCQLWWAVQPQLKVLWCLGSLSPFCCSSPSWNPNGALQGLIRSTQKCLFCVKMEILSTIIPLPSFSCW